MAERPAHYRELQRKGPSFPNVHVVGRRRALGEDLYHSVLTMPWWRFFLTIIGVFIGGNCLFALAYSIQPGSIANARPGSLEDAFFFSVQTMATIGYGTMSPATRFGHIMVTLEAILGMLGVALVTGITFAKFARPTARVLFSEKALITPRNGAPHLMFRVANWRHNFVLEAQLRAFVLVEERTQEGEVLRVPIDLPLVRDRTALFAMTWTAMHRIDEESPFHGAGALERLREKKAEIFLSLTGTDETLAQTIHARYGYTLDEIVVGARFADVLQILPDRTRVIDYGRFHDVVMIDPYQSPPPPESPPPESPPPP